MKSLTTLFSMLFVMNTVHAQNNMTIDTIFANEQKVVSLFFPDPIRQGITGSPNYAFSYNREKEQYFGLLQATPGEKSNLLVITSSGKVYSYILSHSQKLKKLHYFIDSTESVGHEHQRSHPNTGTSTKTITITKTDSLRKDRYSKLCRQLLGNPRSFKQVKFRDGIKVRMAKSVYYANEVYIVFEIENGSKIDFEINALDLYTVNGNNKRKSSYQELLLPPIYKYKIPAVVPKGQHSQFVCVYPKFTLDKNERLLVKLEELNGNRDVLVKSSK